MSKISLGSYLAVEPCIAEEPRKETGPYVTISRQYGCSGYLVGQHLVEMLNRNPKDPALEWKIYNKFILNQLATETNLAVEFLERERRAKPNVVLDLLRTLGSERIPSGLEIRKKITTIIRGLAIRGQAIFIGQGGVHATTDIPGGLSVRLEAPKEWRIGQIALQQGVGARQAEAIIDEKENERDYLRRLYIRQSQQEVPFQLTYDCSAFTTEQIAEHVFQALIIKKVF